MESLFSSLPPVQVAGRKLVGRVVFGLLLVGAALLGSLSGLLIVYSTDLPQVDALERFRPSSVTLLYDDQNRVIGSFALQRRILDNYDDFPKVLRDAVISIEDKDFERHWGVNFGRVLSAAYRDMTTGGRSQGASTLTMQLSRNLFLSPDRTYRRKIQEVMLAIQIERRFTKPQIFAMYGNQIFLGHGVYGFEAGAQFYFSKKAKDLTLAEAALLAALPKAPNAYSPIEHPDKALRRRNLVIDNMLEDGKITVAQANQAKDAPLGLNLRYDTNSVAPWFAEEVRQYLEKKYGSDEVHEGGLRVYTSLDLDLQNTATQALRDGLAAYERRHGWKGNLPNVAASGDTVESYQDPDWIEPILVGGYEHALVTQVTPAAATVKFGPYTAVLDAKDIAWTGQRSPRALFKPGDVVYVKILALEADHTAQVSLEQDSGTQGALIALDNATGDILAMVGGRDFDRSKFNRATQALRQVGSSFKPYIYTAAIDAGYTPEDTILDAPVTFPSSSGPYSPHNYDNKFEGVITLRRALAQSRNIPALKLAAKVGIRTVIDYAHKFGITTDIPPFLPIALGAADMTVIEHTDAFTTFPNDGVRVVPRYIRKVTDYDGKVLEENYPEVQDVVSARTARIMTSMLEEVVQHGTGYQAAKLKHPLAGKTGTTNDFTDAWFLGFSPSLTCGVWVGFDEKKTLGNKETGAMAALPIWMSFMKVAIQGHPNEEFLPPPTLPPPAVAEQVTTPDHAPGGDTENH